MNSIPSRIPKATNQTLWASFSSGGGRAFGVAVLGLAVLAIYAPAFRGEWLWDDDFDIPKNELLRSAAGLWNVWFQPTTLDYYPLKFSVQWLQWQLWGDSVLGYHLTNVGLHLVSAILLWRLFEKLGVKLAWFGALLFAIHPLAVESVAWIAELKNVLALPPLLLSFTAWLEHAERPTTSRYWRSVAWFLVSMLCKSSAVMFPCLLLFHALLMRGRITRTEMGRLLPFFTISLVLGLVTLELQHGRAMQGAVVSLGGPLERIALGGSTLAFYLWKCIWPFPLLPIYPRWSIGGTAVWQFLPWLGLGALSLWLWLQRSGGTRLALFGLGWSVGHLLPFVGFVPISFMRFTWAMDHMAYLSILGVSGVAAGCLGTALDRSRRAGQFALLGSAALLLFVFAILANRHARLFASARALWSHELQHHPDSAIAHNNLGLALEARGESASAIEHYRRAVHLDENFFEARTNLGIALRASGRPDDAIRELRTALDSRTGSSLAHFNLAFAYHAAGRLDAALAEFDDALRLKPDWPVALYSRGLLARQLGQSDAALRDFSAAVKLDPKMADAHNELALMLLDLNRAVDASEELQLALRLKPASAEYHNNFATVLAALGRAADSIEHFRQAVGFRPDYADAHLNLGIALANGGRPTEALPHLEAATRLNPESVRAHFNLGQALFTAGRNQDALHQLETANQLNPNHPSIHEYLGRTLINLGRTADAVRELEIAQRLDPNNASIRQNLAAARALPAR